MYANKTALYILGFLFLLLQSSVVWISDEILLVISFALFYLLGYQQIKYSITDFFLERNLSFKNSFYPFLKELAIQDLKAQKEFQYFKNINLAYLVFHTIEQEKELFDLAKNSIQESRKSIFESKCTQVARFEDSYKSEMADYLVDSLLEEMFDFSKSSSSFQKDFYQHQVSLLSSSIR